VIWTISPHLTACVAGDAIILLDLRRDRYSRAPAGIASQMRDWFSAGGGAPPKTVGEFLVRSGLTDEVELAAISAAADKIRIPRSVPEDVPPAPLARREAAGIASQVGATWLALRTRRLEPLIHDHRARRGVPSPTDPTICLSKLAAYHRTRRLVPIRKNCLLDSLALDRWLGARTGPRRIVFGVTAEPFLAHCWLQTGDLLLNDHPDHVRRYAPILVV
jgi:hypothetical protein